MQEGTASSPLFENSAKELVRTLEQHTDGSGRHLEWEARKLVDVFRSWAKQRPSDAERVARINELLELHRRVMDFHTNARPPSNRPNL